jgi:hypothetical protein
MLVSQGLASSVLKCKIRVTYHGSDHYATEKLFDVEVPEHAFQPRLLFKMLSGTRFGSVLLTHCKIDQRVATFRGRPTA